MKKLTAFKKKKKTHLIIGKIEKDKDFILQLYIENYNFINIYVDKYKYKRKKYIS